MRSQIKTAGAIAQLVEQRTENPCVPGSNPGGTTAQRGRMKVRPLFYCNRIYSHFGNLILILEYNSEIKIIIPLIISSLILRTAVAHFFL